MLDTMLKSGTKFSDAVDIIAFYRRTVYNEMREEKKLTRGDRDMMNVVSDHLDINIGDVMIRKQYMSRDDKVYVGDK
jgi:Mg2+/Co2+ transporter CorB